METRTLIIGEDIKQCVDCEVWYEVEIGHDCPQKDNPYRKSNLKTPEDFSRMRRVIYRDLQEVLDRCAELQERGK